MKYIFTFSICIFLLFSCNSTKNGNKDENTKTIVNLKKLPTKIELETVSRGFYNLIVVENNVAFVKKKRGGTPEQYILSSEQLNQLKVSYNKFELEKLNEYLSPSNLRYSDASSASSLKILADNVEYQSNDFDTSNPPVDFVELVKNMLSIIDVKK